MNPSGNVFLIGPMGAGKSSLGKRLAHSLGLDFVDLDREIEQQAGAPVALIFELDGEAGFRARETQCLRETSRQSGIVLGCGGGVILAPENRQLLRRGGFVVYLAAGVEEQLKRLARDHSRPLLAVPDRRQRLQALAAERNPLYDETADLRVMVDQMPLSRASSHVAELLAKHWQRTTTFTEQVSRPT